MLTITWGVTIGNRKNSELHNPHFFRADLGPVRIQSQGLALNMQRFPAVSFMLAVNLSGIKCPW